MPEQTRYARLAKITQLINSNLDLKVTLTHVVTAISDEVVRCNSVGIYLPQSNCTFRGYVGKPHHFNGVTIDQMVIDPQTDLLARDIIRTRKSIYIPDTSLDQRPDRKPIEAFQIKSLLGLPISFENELFGLVFLFDSGCSMNLTASEIQTVEAYVNMAAVAIRNSKLFTHSQALLKEKQLLLDVSRELALCSSTEKVLETCFHYVGQILNNRNIGVHLCDSIGERFRPAKLDQQSDWAEKEWKKAFAFHNLEIENDPVFQEVIRTKKSILIRDIDKDPRPNKELCSTFGIKGILMLPLVATGEILGTISIVNLEKIPVFSEIDINLAQSIVDVTASALSNVIRMEQLELMIDARTVELREKNKRLEHALSENQRLSHQTELILNSAGEGIYGVDLDGKITFCNPSAAQMLGYTTTELIGQSQDLLNKERKDDFFYRKNGSSFPIESLSTSILENNQIVGAVVTFKDITERKKTEDLVRKTDKLSVLGELAAGVAHEIRNPLTSLKGFIQLLQSDHTDKEEYFTIMLSELDRINTIAGEFLFLSKPQVSCYSKKDLLTMLDNVVTLLHSQALLQNVEINIESPLDFLFITCAENQLKQAFINILKNAIEAIPSGGSIKVKVRQHDPLNVSIRFIDQGFGIPSERIISLGEPFYTTKEKGSGLGLMVSFKIIKDHNGEINIKSKQNKGTIVEVILPIGIETLYEPVQEEG